MIIRISESGMWDGIVELKTRCVCETPNAPETAIF